jgi:hypothetical protein
MSGIQKHLGNYKSVVLYKTVKSLNVTFREKKTTLDIDTGLYLIQHFVVSLSGKYCSLRHNLVFFYPLIKENWPCIYFIFTNC